VSIGCGSLLSCSGWSSCCSVIGCSSLGCLAIVFVGIAFFGCRFAILPSRTLADSSFRHYIGEVNSDGVVARASCLMSGVTLPCWCLSWRSGIGGGMLVEQDGVGWLVSLYV